MKLSLVQLFSIWYFRPVRSIFPICGYFFVINFLFILLFLCNCRVTSICKILVALRCSEFVKLGLILAWVKRSVGFWCRHERISKRRLAMWFWRTCLGRGLVRRYFWFNRSIMYKADISSRNLDLHGHIFWLSLIHNHEVDVVNLLLLIGHFSYCRFEFLFSINVFKITILCK